MNVHLRWITMASLLVVGCTPRPVRDPAPAIVLVDRLSESGIGYRHRPPSKRPGTILDTIGRGCAFLDYDRDGNADVFLVGDSCGLYRGDGKGRFEDVSESAGISRLQGRLGGIAVADWNRDGWLDVYLSGYRGGVLLRNESGRKFVPVADSGIGPQEWGTTAAWCDFDRDNLPDLYIGNYVRFGAGERQLCKSGSVLTSCPPGQYDGIAGRLYRNLGDGKFGDVTASMGMSGSPGKTLGVAWQDVDGDGRPDLALANDEVPGELYHHVGNRFVAEGAEAGVAYSSVGKPHAGMGQDWGDYNNDSRPDLAVATFSTESKPVYESLPGGLFVDRSGELGMGPYTVDLVSFGLKWFDGDNDGWLDLIVASGHTSDNIEATGKGGAYRQPTVLMRNRGGKRFERIRSADLDRAIVGRGLAVGDYDNDGRVDVLVVDNEGAPLLLHNETPRVGRWISLRLDAGPSVHDPAGARVRVAVGSRVVERTCHADGSYLSSSSPDVHFGLGDADTVAWVEVRWLDGKVERRRWTGSVNRIVRWEELR